MRNTFHQFFRPTKAELDEMLANALICYDASVLLNIYRYSDETQTALVDVFRAFVGRTFLPHQVALEFARNRPKTIVDQVSLCQSAEDAFRKVISDFITPKNKQPFLSIGSTKALEGVMTELAAKRAALEYMISEDKHADLLVSLFDKKIGEAPDAAALDKLHQEANDRYAKKTPPGYSDLKDKDVPEAYGDYIVWRQLMDIAEKEKKDFIFVTDDSKEDWRQRIGGKTIGPRPALLEEFRRETGQRIWLFTSEGFLIATKEAGSTHVSESVIKEVGERFVAQTSTLVSEDKLSSPRIDREQADMSSSSVKLSGRGIEDKTGGSAKEASFREADIGASDEKVVAPHEKMSGAANEGIGGEE